jgi:hypothetical protein
MHDADAGKLIGVVAAVRALGAPTIRVVDCGDHYVALEGVHRLAACAQLGIAPVLDVLEQDDLVAADSLDWPDLRRGEQYTAGELAGEAYSPGSGVYTINPDGTIDAL